MTSGKPCHRWPVNGHRRCHRHGAGYTRNRVDNRQRGTNGRFIPKDTTL